MKTLKHEEKPEALIFGGGGGRIIASLAAYNKLVSLKVIDPQRVKLYSGVSAGAILAAFLACGACAGERKSLLGLDMTKFKDDKIGYLRDGYKLLKRYGFCKGQTLLDWLNDSIASLTGHQCLTFKGLYDLTGHALHVWTFNVNHRERWEFSPFKNYDTIISKAVRASCSIPGFYQPVEINGDLHTDGGWACNYPDLPVKSHKLGIKLISTSGAAPRQEIKRSWQMGKFISAHVEAAMDSGEGLYVSKELWKNTIEINTENIKATQFELNEVDRNFLIEAGEAAAVDYHKEKYA